MTFIVIISHFRGMLIAIVRRINCNEEQRVISLSVLKFSTGIDIFINTSKTEFSHVLIDSPVQCYPEMQILCKIFVHGISWNHFLNGAPLCAHRGI